MAEKSAEQDFLAAYSWCGFAPDDGEIRIYACQDDLGIAKPSGNRAFAFGYHNEPAVGLDLLFVRPYHVIDSMGGYVWSWANDLGTAFAADGGLYTIGVSDGSFIVFDEGEPFIPAEIDSVDETWGTITTLSGDPPVETTTWRYRLEATGVSLTLPLDGGTTVNDCYRITNNNSGEIEYYSPSIGGLVAIDKANGDRLLLSERSTDPNLLNSVALAGDS